MPRSVPSSPSNRFQRRPLLTSLLLLGLLLLTLEAGLRLLTPPTLEFAHAARQVYRYHPKWYTDFRPGASTRFELDHEGEPYLDFSVSINEYGFRGEVEADPEGLASGFVHAVGDSFTMGWGVEAAASYPAELERITGLSVLNLGLNGFGAIGATGKSLALEERFPLRAAVYLATENDYADDRKAQRHAGRPRILHGFLDGINVIRRHSLVASLPFALRWWTRLSNIEPASREAVGSGEIIRLAEDEDSSDPTLGVSTKRALLRYASHLKLQRVPFLVLVHGDGPLVRDLARFCRERGVEVHSLVFAQDLLIPREGHLNERGTSALASYVAEWLRNQGTG